MHAAIFVPIFAAAALAQSTSSPSVDAFPQTSFLRQTNSLGVVTGQPAVATSIPNQASADVSLPPAVTTQPPAASIPALGTGIHTVIQGIPGTNSTRTLVVSISNSTTSVVQPTPSGPSGSGASGIVTGTASGSGSGASGSTPSTTHSQGAAATMKAMAGSLVGAGAIMAAFL